MADHIEELRKRGMITSLAKVPGAKTDSIEVLRGAVARGWCSPENAGKTVDPVLAEAIVQEVIATIAAQQPEPQACVAHATAAKNAEIEAGNAAEAAQAFRAALEAARELPFVIEDRAGTMVLDWSKKGGQGCRPATEPEIQLWRALAQQPEARVGGEVSYAECCDTPAYCSSVRRCTAKDTPPPSAVPAGWKLVPVEPTEAMKAAGCRALGAIYGHFGVEQCWKTMLAATPAPKEGE